MSYIRPRGYLQALEDSAPCPLGSAEPTVEARGARDAVQPAVEEDFWPQLRVGERKWSGCNWVDYKRSATELWQAIRCPDDGMWTVTVRKWSYTEKGWSVSSPLTGISVVPSKETMSYAEKQFYDFLNEVMKESIEFSEDVLQEKVRAVKEKYVIMGYPKEYTEGHRIPASDKPLAAVVMQNEVVITSAISKGRILGTYGAGPGTILGAWHEGKAFLAHFEISIDISRVLRLMVQNGFAAGSSSGLRLYLIGGSPQHFLECYEKLVEAGYEENFRLVDQTDAVSSFAIDAKTATLYTPVQVQDLTHSKDLGESRYGLGYVAGLDPVDAQC